MMTEICFDWIFEILQFWFVLLFSLCTCHPIITNHALIALSGILLSEDMHKVWVQAKSGIAKMRGGAVPLLYILARLANS